MSDRATFDRLILSAIHGDFPACLLCGANAVDWHHLFGRGGRDKKRRLVHSSVFNACPLCRKCHSRGDIKSFSAELMEKVVSIIAKSTYQMNNKDAVFLNSVSYPLPKSL